MVLEGMLYGLDLFNRIFCCASCQCGNHHRGRSTTRKRNVNANRKKGKKRYGAKAMARRSQSRKIAPNMIGEETASIGSFSRESIFHRGTAEDEMEYNLDPIKLIPIPNGGYNVTTNYMNPEWKIRDARHITRLRKSKGRSRMASDSSVSTRTSQYSADTQDDSRSLGSQSFSRVLHRNRNRIAVNANTRRE